MEGETVKSNPLLKWGDVKADFYNLQISEVGENKPKEKVLESGKYVPWFLNNPTLFEKKLTKTSYKVPINLKDKTYYSWRVQAVKDSNNSNWSEIGYFFTDFSTPVEEQPNSSESINIYPNPANSSVTIDINMMFAESIIIELFNTLGQKLNSTNLNSVAGQTTYRHIINIEELPSGLYYIVVSSGDMKEVRSLVKM